MLIGLFLSLYIFSRKKDGVIHVTKSKDDKPDTYLFEFNVPPEDIPSMKQVVFQVRIEKDSDS